LSLVTRGDATERAYRRGETSTDRRSLAAFDRDGNSRAGRGRVAHTEAISVLKRYDGALARAELKRSSAPREIWIIREEAVTGTVCFFVTAAASGQ
jgi:hypothetical protein